MPIQVALPNGEIGEFPDGMPDAEIERVLAAQFGGGQPAQPKPAPEWSDVLKRGASNIPASFGRFAGDMWEAITSPVQTAKALGNTALGYGQMAVGAQGEERKLAEGMNAYFKDRYGSEDGFKRAIAEDPVGVLADASTVFTGVGGALKGGATVAAKAGATGRALEAAKVAGSVAAKAGELTDPIMLAGKAAYPLKATGRYVGDLITGGQPLAEKLYGSAIKPSPKLTPEERLNVLRTGIDERVVPTQRGLDKLNRTINELGDKADVYISSRGRRELAGSDPINIVPADIANAAQADALRVYGNTVSPTADVAVVNGVISDFLNNYDGSNMWTPRAQEIKKATYEKLEKAYKGELTGPDTTAQKAITRGIKDAIARNVPDVAPINDRLHNLYELRPQAENALGRTQNHNFIGLGAMLGGGAVGGSAGLLGPGLMTAGAIKILSEPANVARAAFIADALSRAGKRTGGLLDKLPSYMNRRSLTYPAYVDRMRQEDN